MIGAFEFSKIGRKNVRMTAEMKCSLQIYRISKQRARLLCVCARLQLQINCVLVVAWRSFVELCSQRTWKRRNRAGHISFGQMEMAIDCVHVWIGIANRKCTLWIFCVARVQRNSLLSGHRNGIERILFMQIKCYHFWQIICNWIVCALHVNYLFFLKFIFFHLNFVIFFTDLFFK